MPELWANVALHNTFERFDRPQAAALFQMLLDVPIEEIVHRGSSSERLTLARGIATVHRHRLQDALGRSPSSLGGDLAVLPDREPAGPAVLVAITDEVGPVAARHDAHAESSKLLVVSDDGASFSRPEAFHRSLCDLDVGFAVAIGVIWIRHGLSRAPGRPLDGVGTTDHFEKLAHSRTFLRRWKAATALLLQSRCVHERAPIVNLAVVHAPCTHAA
jgi:hypothetical protein